MGKRRLSFETPAAIMFKEVTDSGNIRTTKLKLVEETDKATLHQQRAAMAEARADAAERKVLQAQELFKDLKGRALQQAEIAKNVREAVSKKLVAIDDGDNVAS